MKKLLSFMGILFILTMFLCKQPPAVAFDKNNGAKDQTIKFAVDGGNMYFFDTSSQSVYIYSTRGQLRSAYQIVELGEKLKSLSTFDIRELTQNR